MNGLELGCEEPTKTHPSSPAMTLRCASVFSQLLSAVSRSKFSRFLSRRARQRRQQRALRSQKDSGSVKTGKIPGAYKFASNAEPSGLPNPVHGSQPGPAEYAPLFPAVISRNVARTAAFE